ncbi:putative fatty acyl-CoA reductase CG5065 [Metopolophium dirhodum]|uniref:putative fatty acyl-CoA reductase CG5065 n=1 Tax=Metopolophium dirhodum TaxID=44670 RepID=UPI00298FFC1D|nr:putative fatty acyl-CoA reductase CG5065 [Metopolophium dirhodum]XP_060858060.1 putative fatty acyl-CoA reductase CG5065 [Metopolophium dirhodum]
MTNESVCEWYSGRSVFITGGTGYMGKVLIEKLLRDCGGVKTIYVLCRPKRGFSPTARIEQIRKLAVFERVRTEFPDRLKKIKAMEGDLGLPGLGLSNENKSILVNDVSIVFNGAASLRLESGLKDAIRHNTTGTKHVLDLAVEMKNLASFVHLSTAFCHCEYDTLEETIYPSPANPEDVMRAVEWMDDHTLETITPRLLGPHPNCYTYSKRLAESLVSEYASRIPISVGRPSIVTPSFKEPVPGWVDSLNGPVGVIVAGGKGVIRSMLCSPDYEAEVVPVDIAINALILIAWKRTTIDNTIDDMVPCYNISKGDIVRLTWGEVLSKGKRYAYEYPFDAGLWYPNGSIRTNKLVHYFIVLMLQVIPAYLIDGIMLLARQKTFMVRVQKRIAVGMEVLQYFTMRSWNFKIENTKALINNLNEEDTRKFYIQNTEIDVEKYMIQVLLGARQYCMKEPLANLDRARFHLKLQYWLHLATKLVFSILLLWVFVRAFDSFKYLLDSTTNSFTNVPIIGSLIPK